MEKGAWRGIGGGRTDRRGLAMIGNNRRGQAMIGGAGNNIATHSARLWWVLLSPVNPCYCLSLPVKR